MASEHDGQPSPALPSEGQNSRFDGQILDPQWSDPLYLMMAALVARRRHLHAGAKGGELLDAMTLNRVDLALKVAKHERRRLEQFAEGTGGAANRLFCHMAVCVTLCGGLTAEEAGCAVTEEAAALGLAWPAGPGALAVILHRALPADDRGAAPVQPDIVAEAFVLDMLRDEGLSRHGQRDTVLRAARRNHARVAATLFHAFQSFAGDDQRTADLLDWIDALVSAGLSENPGWLLAIEGALPRQTTKLRESAARVTRQLYDQIRAATDAAPYFRGELARVASNLAIRLSELGRREEALELAEEAVEIRKSLAKQNPDAFRPDLAMSLNNLANRLSELGRREKALEPAEEAVEIYRSLAKQNPDAFGPDLASSLGMYGQICEANGKNESVWTSFRDAIEVLRPQFYAVPAAFVPLMGALVRNYFGICKKLNREPDAKSLAPILEILRSASDVK